MPVTPKITATVTIDCDAASALKIIRAAGRDKVRCRVSLHVPVRHSRLGPEWLPTIERGSCAAAVEKLKLFLRQTKLLPADFDLAKSYADQLAEYTKDVPGLRSWEDNKAGS